MVAFTPEALLRLKLLRILETAGQRVLTYTLLSGTPGKNPTDTLFEYLDKLPDTSTAKYMHTKQRRKWFAKDDQMVIRNDTSCRNFHITLLYKAITVACEGWDDPANQRNQFLVKKIKDTRNMVVHEERANMTKVEFLVRLDELQSNFLEILDETKVKYNTEEVEYNMKKREVLELVNTIRDTKLTVNEMLRISLDHLLPDFQKEVDEELKQKISSAKLLDPPHFLKGHEDRRVDVNDIYTETCIQEENKERKIIHHLKLLNLAQGGSASLSPHLILVEGDAGSGKTTLLTYTLSEYLKEEESDRRMEGLDYYQLLLWVVCREESSRTLESLLKRLLKPDADFRYRNQLIPLLQCNSVLFIIDGVDEMNDASRLLVSDILRQAEGCPRFTLLATSRPEAIQAMKNNTLKNYKVSHLKLEGVSINMRTELALRHYRWLCGNEPRDEVLLRQVMEQVAWKQIFRLPRYILFFVTFFYIEPQKLTTTITQTKLYQMILEWCVVKLVHRLAGRPKVPTEPLLGITIKHFLCKLYKTALKGLIQNKIYITDDDIIYLTDFCKAKDLPVQETLLAFYSLRRVEADGVSTAQYHAPHQSLQDFLAAWHLHICLNNNYKPGYIRHVLDSTAGQHLKLERLKNMLSHLLGLQLADHEGKPMVKAVEEIVDLLHESGIRRSDDWLSVLADTEVHHDIVQRVTYHINSDDDDNDNDINVVDGTVHIAAALLPQIRRRKVTITLTRDQNGIDALFSVLDHHDLNRLMLQHHYQHPYLDASSAPLLQKFPRSDMKWFKGHLDAGHLKELLPEGLTVLYLVVEGNDHALSLLPALKHIRKTLPHLEQLRLHIRVSTISATSLTSLPDRDGPCVHLCLSGVDDGKMEAAVVFAAKLHPRRRGYDYVSFPGATLGAAGWKRVLERLSESGVRVRECVCVPDTTVTVDEENELYILAQDLLGCDFDREREGALWL